VFVRPDDAQCVAHGRSPSHPNGRQISAHLSSKIQTLSSSTSSGQSSPSGGSLRRGAGGTGCCSAPDEFVPVQRAVREPPHHRRCRSRASSGLRGAPNETHPPRRGGPAPSGRRPLPHGHQDSGSDFQPRNESTSGSVTSTRKRPAPVLVSSKFIDSPVHLYGLLGASIPLTSGSPCHAKNNHAKLSCHQSKNHEAIPR